MGNCPKIEFYKKREFQPCLSLEDERGCCFLKFVLLLHCEMGKNEL